MTSLYGISYYGIEQHITLTLPAWRCLFTVRDYMTLFNTIAGMRWCSGMSLASHGEGPWFDTHTILCSISYFLLLSLFCTFCSLFTQWLIYPFSFHIEILILSFIFHLATLGVVAKIVMHVKIGDLFVQCC